MSKERILILSQLNPLDNVPVKSITGIEKVGDTIKIFYKESNGDNALKVHASTAFLMQQINEYNLKVYSRP